MAADLLKPSILCIDDDPEDHELVCSAINQIAPTYHVMHAKNGVEGLTMLQELYAAKRLPCLIILDINMPVMDGTQMLREVKTNPNFKNIPIVVLTTGVLEKAREIFVKYQVDVFLKANKWENILTQVEKLLSYCSKKAT